LIISLLAAWPVRQMLVWFPPGSDFPPGWKSAVAPSITLTLVFLGIFILPAERGAFRAALVAALLLTVGVDYKVFGTSKWFDASEGSGGGTYDRLPGLDDVVFQRLRADTEHRIALDTTSPFAPELRHYGLTTPQGFDPMLTTQYQSLIKETEHFRSSFEIDIDPANKTALDLLGVRFFLTSKDGPMFSRLSTDPEFRLLQPATSRLQVFDYLKAQPPYGWVSGSGDQGARSVLWQPEARDFIVHSEAGGRFSFAEQADPGWQATVDGSPVGIDRWSGAFQSVPVPPGEHRLTFRFCSFGLRVGALVSLAAAILLVLLFLRSPATRAMDLD
jgi:hypothetical protein